MKTVAFAAFVIGTSFLAVNGAEARAVKPAFRAAAIQQCKINQMNNKPLSSQCRSLLHVRPRHHKARHKAM